MKSGNNKISIESESQQEDKADYVVSHKIQELEHVVKKQRLELDCKNSEIALLRKELDEKNKLSCGNVFHSYVVYRGTNTIAPCDCRKDYTSILPNEIMVKIFHYLPQMFIPVCSFVCRRWQQLSCNSSLWTEVKLYNKVIFVERISCLIALGGTKKLILWNMEIHDHSSGEVNVPLDPSDDIHQHTDYNKLEELEMCCLTVEKSVLSKFIQKCSAVTSLTIEDCFVDDDVCKSISKLKNLIVLRLIRLEFYPHALKKIMKKCTNLTKLDLSGCTEWLAEPPLYFPSQLSQLVLKDVFTINGSNEDLKHILESCPNLVVLNIDRCIGLTPVSIHYISSYLPKLQYLSLLGNDSLNYSLCVLKNISPLQEICMTSDDDDIYSVLQSSLKNVRIIDRYFDEDESDQENSFILI